LVGVTIWGKYNDAGRAVPADDPSVEVAGALPACPRRPMMILVDEEILGGDDVALGMPSTSVMWVMRREPSRRRAAWTMTSTEPQIMSRMVFDGSEKPPMVIMIPDGSGLARAVGVQRAHRAVVAGVHGLQQVEGLRSAHLADDDPLGTHAQAVLDQVAHGDLALALEVRRPGLEAHDVRLLQLQLGGVLAGDDALVVSM
jgi:hypothetical protein